MGTLLFFLFATIACIAAAQRLATARGRSARGWMMAAALLGPLPLVPLAVLARRA
jgi:hypothetical protein